MIHHFYSKPAADSTGKTQARGVAMGGGGVSSFYYSSAVSLCLDVNVTGLLTTQTSKSDIL